MTHARSGPYGSETSPPSAFAQSNPVLLVVSALVGVAAIAVLSRERFVEPYQALLFGLLIACGEVARVRLPGGREAAPLGSAVALAYMLVTLIGEEPARQSTAQCVVVAGLGFLAGALPHLAARRPTTLDFAMRRFLLAAMTAWLFRTAYLTAWLRPDWSKMETAVSALQSAGTMVAMGAALVAAMTADFLIGAALQTTRHRRPFDAALRDELRVTVPVGATIATTALLVGLACRTMSIWVLPLLCLPLLFTQLSLRRYSRIKDVHLETIRALSRITEVAGLTEPGHARRVARTSDRIGRELGLSERELLDLEYACLMHDIGQLSLTDPLHGGRTTTESLERQRELAHAGAEVIRRAGALDRVADLVENIAEPVPHGGPLGSRILRAANAFDDLAGPAPDRAHRVQALNVIRMGLAVHYDPAVVESLSRIVGDET